MKKKKILFLVLMSCLCLFNSCKKKTQNSESGSASEITDPILDVKLVDQGSSNYTIVLPDEISSKYITIAANELQDLFYEATSIELPILYDSQLATVREDDHYLSIGKTKVAESAGIADDLSALGSDGLKLYTYGQSVVMIGNEDRGSLYAVYEFLERQFSFECYAADEYVIDRQVEDMYLKKYDVLEIPTFERRSVGLFSFSNDETFRNRMRQELYNEGWIYWSHSHFKILPPETYMAEHPDWYSPDGTQLCLTNEEMTQQFTKNVIELIKEYPDCSYISLGQEDRNTFCDCPDCQAAVAKYKESGVSIRFINQVARAVKQYLDENENGRPFYLSTFAYQKTQYAPVDENKQPLHDSVIPDDNVRILIAPIYACNSHNYYDVCNSDINALFTDWNVVAKDKIYTWIYNKIFACYFLPFNNYSTLVQNYEILEEIGSKFVYHQGNKETEAGGMQELKSYVEAKLMWDNTLSPEQLTEDFIHQYYKDAAEDYLEYYRLVRFTYTIWEQEGLHCYNSSSKAEAIISASYWTRDLLDQFEQLFQNMKRKIEKYQTTDRDLYEKLNLRIQKEHLTVEYLYLRFYFDEFTYEEAKAMIDDFEYYCAKTGITVWREMYLSSSTECLISSFVASLRSKLNQK